MINISITNVITPPFHKMRVSSPLAALKHFPKFAEKWAYNKHCQ